MGYRHVEVAVAQSAKRPGDPCGDAVHVERTEGYTLLVCADGLGSGIKANVAATLCVSRLAALIRSGFSLREAFARLVRTMNEAREPGLPYAAFSVARFLPGGEPTVLSYEAPPPVLVAHYTSVVLTGNRFTVEGAEVVEAEYRLEPGEGLLLVSDGVTQAGMGRAFPYGWGIDRVARFARDHRRGGADLDLLPEAVHRQARRYDGTDRGDDCTACLALCREGKVVTVFTGPPAQKALDGAAVAAFMAGDGAKVVCGATTAKLVARHLGRELRVREESLDSIAPPYYEIDGVDLVTEGAVTLNQALNILDEDQRRYEPNSGVSRLCALLRGADRINFLVGRAPNAANEDIAFRQQGILSRATVIPLLAERLQEAGKLVVVRFA